MAVFPETPERLPSPPFVAMKGINNFRDLGGYPIANKPTRSIRRHYIYRSAEPSCATKESITKLQSLKIKKIFDFRRDAEFKKNFYNFPGIERVSADVSGRQDEGEAIEDKIVFHTNQISDDHKALAYAYKLPLDNATNAYAKVVRGLSELPPSENAVLLHCAGGKERTGLICALLLSLCGVSDEVVADEYARTEAAVAGLFEARVKHIMDMFSVSEDIAKQMAPCKKEIMIAALPMIREEYGGAEGYFKNHCGLSDKELEQVKAHMIVDEKSIFL